MQITEIRIKLMEGSEDRLRAFCSITIDDCFVIRDLKIIDGTSGPFVAMPSRKLAAHCHRCGHKNHLRASYCNHCGIKLSADSGGNIDSPQKLYADVAHPINSACREMIQQAVISEFEAELSLSHQPGYRSRYDDEFDEANRAAAGRPAADRPAADRAEADRAEAGPVEATAGDDAASGDSSAGGEKALGEEPIREGSPEASSSDAGDSGPSEEGSRPSEGSHAIPKAAPPRPHFIDGPAGRRERQAQGERPRERQTEDRPGHAGSEDREDDFGAGIF